MKRNEIHDIAKTQSAIDYNFDKTLLDQEGFYIIEPSKPSKQARNYLKEALFLNFVYYGKSLVCVADNSIKKYVKKYIEDVSNSLYRVFDAPNISILNKELEKYEMQITHIADFYLPDPSQKVSVNDKLEMKIFEGEDLTELYQDKRFNMALCYRCEGERKDVLAIAAYVDGEIAGVAGCSNDSETMWQIGIDVVEGFRNQKIASTLVHTLSNEVIKRGKVPFYCTAYSNIASRNTAISAGFRPTWVELTAKKIR